MLPPLFTADYLSRLETLRIQTRRRFLGSRPGGHVSLRRGAGLEFAEYPATPPALTSARSWGRMPCVSMALRRRGGPSFFGRHSRARGNPGMGACPIRLGVRASSPQKQAADKMRRMAGLPGMLRLQRNGPQWPSVPLNPVIKDGRDAQALGDDLYADTPVQLCVPVINTPLLVVERHPAKAGRGE